MRILGVLQTHTTDTFLFISHTTNVPLFKFRYNIFIGVRIIKEIPGSVPSGTHCIFKKQNPGHIVTCKLGDGGRQKVKTLTFHVIKNAG
jgi:hypothetical protein